MGVERSRIPGDPAVFERMKGGAMKVQNREIRDSGVRGRAEFSDLPIKEKIPMPDPASISEEAKEKAKELGLRVNKLLEVYKEMPGERFPDNTSDYLVACLTPNTKDYVFNHLRGLDGLYTYAESNPRLLPNVEKAIMAWEALNGVIPNDFVDDGLEVEGNAMLNMRDFFEQNMVSDADGPDARSIKERSLRSVKNKMPPDLIQQIEELVR